MKRWRGWVVAVGCLVAGAAHAGWGGWGYYGSPGHWDGWQGEWTVSGWSGAWSSGWAYGWGAGGQAWSPVPGVAVACPVTLTAGSSGRCPVALVRAGASLSGMQWQSSEATVLAVDSDGLLTAGTVASDTPVTLTASYGEGNAVYTHAFTVTVKAVALSLSSVSLTGSTTVQAGESVSYAALAHYSNGSSKSLASGVRWSVSGSGATVDDSGRLTVAANLESERTVLLTASYVEGGVSRSDSLRVTLRAAAASAECAGSGSKQLGISVSGSTTRRLGQDGLTLNYCLKNFAATERYDQYVSVLLPDGSRFYLQAGGVLGTPTLSSAVLPYRSNALLPDFSGTALWLPLLEAGLPTGVYGFATQVVPVGANPLAVGTVPLAQAQTEVSFVR